MSDSIFFRMGSQIQTRFPSSNDKINLISNKTDFLDLNKSQINKLNQVLEDAKFITYGSNEFIDFYDSKIDELVYLTFYEAYYLDSSFEKYFQDLEKCLKISKKIDDAMGINYKEEGSHCYVLLSVVEIDYNLFRIFKQQVIESIFDGNKDSFEVFFNVLSNNKNYLENNI